MTADFAQRVGLLLDDPSLTESLRRMLSRRGLEVREALSASAATDLLCDPPDLLIARSSSSSLELVAELRNTHSAEALAIVLLTEEITETQYARAFAAGADDCMPVSVNPTVLLTKVLRLLSRIDSQQAEQARQVRGDTLALGLLFQRYEIHRLLGRGNYGRVYAATDTTSGQVVALKILEDEHCRQPESRLRFEREAYALAASRDPCLPKLIEVGRGEEGRAYYAMEWIEGPTLTQYLRQHGPLSERQLKGLLIPLARVLLKLEAAKLIHRDIKPDNIVLRGGSLQAPVLVDFGLAKRAFDRGLTSANVILGSAGYMSPESLLESQLDCRSDVFSLGVVAYYAYTGEEVFPEFGGIELVQAMTLNRIRFPHSISPRLRAVLHGITEIDRERRLSITKLLEGLGALPASPKKQKYARSHLPAFSLPAQP